MILRPVSPASPVGPPRTNLPVGLTSSLKSEVSIDSWLRSASTVLTTFSRMSGVSVLSRSMLSTQHAVLADLGQPARQAVGESDRQRHQFGGVLDGIAEHQALVARALLVQRVTGALDPRLVGGVDAL